MTPRILAVRSALPHSRCVQADFTRAFAARGQMSPAERVLLAEVGNLSSASVLHILEMISETERPPAGSPGLMIGLGPGVSAELVLLRW